MPTPEKITLPNGTVHYVVKRLNGDGPYFHREDGPAVIWPNGKLLWYFWGSTLPFEDWLNKTPISDEEKVMLKLQYG